MKKIILMLGLLSIMLLIISCGGEETSTADGSYDAGEVEVSGGGQATTDGYNAAEDSCSKYKNRLGEFLFTPEDAEQLFGGEWEQSFLEDHLGCLMSVKKGEGMEGFRNNIEVENTGTISLTMIQDSVVIPDLGEQAIFHTIGAPRLVVKKSGQIIGIRCHLEEGCSQEDFIAVAQVVLPKLEPVASATPTPSVATNVLNLDSGDECYATNYNSRGQRYYTAEDAAAQFSGPWKERRHQVGQGVCRLYVESDQRFDVRKIHLDISSSVQSKLSDSDNGCDVVEGVGTDAAFCTRRGSPRLILTKGDSSLAIYCKVETEQCERDNFITVGQRVVSRMN